jgi:hypothetical protein
VAWGIVEAIDGEFLVPDDPGRTPIVPVAPKLCLVAARSDEALSRQEVVALNQIAIGSSRHYLVAHNFSECFWGDFRSLIGQS